MCVSLELVAEAPEVGGQEAACRTGAEPAAPVSRHSQDLGHNKAASHATPCSPSLAIE